MKTLGKISIVLILTFTTLFAEVKAYLSQNSIELGEQASLKIEVISNSDNIDFPNISKIDKFDIESTSQSSQVSIVNGKVTKSNIKEFKFTPDKSISIDSFKVKIDGKEFFTKKLNLVVDKNQSINSSYIKISTNKNSAYIGEAIELTIEFHRNIYENIIDINYDSINFKNFWTKQLDNKSDKREDGNYIIHTLKYIIFPQKSGEIKIDPVVFRITKSNNNQRQSFFTIFNNRTTTKKLFSNSLNLNITSLPKDIVIAGKFKINAKVDKLETNENQPINLTISIDGYGNLDDLEEIKLNIENSTIYDNKANALYKYENGKYLATYEKKFSIISNKNFTIPKIELKYFDLEEKKIKTISTKKYKILVNSSKIDSKIETFTESNSDSKNIEKTISTPISTIITYYILGIISSIGSYLIYMTIKKAKNRKKVLNIPINKRVLKAKNDTELRNILLPYISNSEIKNILFEIENHIKIEKKYDKLSKKEIIEILESKK